MRYAIPVSGGVVSPHFGHCEYFALIDVDEDRKEIISKELVPSPGHADSFPAKSHRGYSRHNGKRPGEGGPELSQRPISNGGQHL